MRSLLQNFVVFIVMIFHKKRPDPDVEQGTESPSPDNKNQKKEVSGDEYEALLNYVDSENGGDANSEEGKEEGARRKRIWYE